MMMTGKCLCGNLSYSANAEPALVCVCHCKDCQRHTGTAFATLVFIPNETFRMEGESKTFTRPGGSGKPVKRLFCPECGSTVVWDAAVAPNMVLIPSGTLDDTSFIKPTRNLFCDSAQSWVPLTQDTHNFPGPPS
jgi:hypothetical protein